MKTSQNAARPRRQLSRVRRLLMAAILLSVFGGAALALIFSGLAHPARFLYGVRGIDVSHHNGPIDWNAVAGDGVRFAWIKATEGSDHRDTRFLTNWQLAVDSGVVVGAYHVFTTCSPGVDQALNFSGAVPHTEGTLPPAIDISSSSACREGVDAAASELKLLIRTLVDAYGKEPVIFVNGEGAVSLDELRYSGCWRRGFLFPPWERQCQFWQYSVVGRVSGIAGNVDLNVFQGSEDEFRNFAAKSDLSTGTTSDP